MPDIAVTPSSVDFSALHERMQWYVDQEILSNVVSVVLKGTDIIDYTTFGFMNRETGEPLRRDAIFRMASNTKIITSVAAMSLFEEGKFDLDDPIARFIPSFKDMSVLKPGAESADDVEPANGPIRMRHILSHSAGLSYGFVDPTSTIDKIYTTAGINPFAGVQTTLEGMCEKLASVPLAYQPGTSWRYSFGTDVTARITEIITGQRFDTVLRERVLDPLGMVDTDFWVPAAKMDRLPIAYAPVDLLQPMKGGLKPMPVAPMDGPPTFLNGGGGLFSTVADYATFIRMIINGGEWAGQRILKPETLELMRTNQLAEGVGVRFPMWAMENTVFGLGFAIKSAPGTGEPPAAKGEYHWGGMAGTHSWMSPAGFSGMAWTQRMPGFWHPFSHDFKRMVYELLAPA